MKKAMALLFILFSLTGAAQTVKSDQESLIRKILIDPSPGEMEAILTELRKQDLSPKAVVVHDSIALSNGNRLYIVSHKVDANIHYGAVIVPKRSGKKKLPVIVFATGGDGIHKEFDVNQDFNHPACRFPNLLGGELDSNFIVVIPSFRGQQLIVGDKKYQSEGNIGDAFDGATTDALALLNVVLHQFGQADNNRIAIYGGSRGGTVALLASARDNRIKRTITVAAPTDMKALYLLYPDQFKLLFFNDLLAGKIAESEARKKFLSSSPIYFTDALQMAQLHHDRNDPFVPVVFAESLVDSMKAKGKFIQPFLYDEGIHGFWSNENYWKRVQVFIRPLLE